MSAHARGELGLLEQEFSPCPRPGRDLLDLDARRYIFWTRASGEPGTNQGDLQTGVESIQMLDELARILATTSERLVPKIGVDGNIHSIR